MLLFLPILFYFNPNQRLICVGHPNLSGLIDTTCKLNRCFFSLKGGLTESKTLFIMIVVINVTTIWGLQMTLDIVGHLGQLGFTEYEARAYTALVRRSPLTGYELAKVSGVPRPNIYAVIEHLQQKGAVLAIGINGGVKYAPVPPDELLSKLSKSFQSHVKEASSSLSQIQNITQIDYIWHLKGYENLIEKAKNILENTKHQTLLGLWPSEAQLLAPTLQALKARGIVPVILCFKGNSEEMCEGVGKVYKLPMNREKGTHWFVLVSDELELLTAEIPSDNEPQGAWTKQKLFVDMATWYIRHSIAVAEIVRSLGPQLREFLDEQALSAIEGVSLVTVDGKPWLEGLLQSLDTEVSLSK